MKVDPAAAAFMGKPGFKGNDGKEKGVAETSTREYPLCKFGCSLENVGVVPKNVQDYRAYMTGVESVAQMGGQQEEAKHVAEIRIRKTHKKKDRISYSAKDNHGRTYPMDFNVNEAMATDLCKRLDTKRGLTSVTVDFKRMDLSRVLAYCMSVCMKYTIDGELTWDQVMGNAPEVYNREAVDGAIDQNSGTVYVPRVSSSDAEAATWSAAIAVVVGSGSRAITDTTEVDTLSRPIIPSYRDGELALGVATVMLKILGLMSVQKCGVIGGFAIYSGANKEVACVGMTNEGGYMRSMARRENFCKSWGALDVSMQTSPICPLPQFGTVHGIATLVDRVLIYMSAMISVCDPMMEIGGRAYPTTFGSGVTDDSIAAPADFATEEAEKAQRNNWAAEHVRSMNKVMPAYAANFAKGIDLMLCTSSDKRYVDSVCKMMMGQSLSMASKLDKHLMYKTVTPFMLINPEGILGKEVKDFRMVEEGYGPYAYVRGGDRTVSGWENASFLSPEASAQAGRQDMFVEYTAARKNPFLQHLMNAENDGLSNLVPFQTAEDGLINCAYGNTRTSNFARRAMNHDDFGSYLWSRQTSRMIMPGEALQLVPGMCIKFTDAQLTSSLNWEGIFRGTSEELLGDVTFRTIQMRPLGVRVRKKKPDGVMFTREIRRNYSVVLAAASVNRGLQGVVSSAFTTPPVSSHGAALGINALHLEEDGHGSVPHKTTSRHVSTVSSIFGVVPTAVKSGRLRHAQGKPKGAKTRLGGKGGISGKKPRASMPTMSAGKKGTGAKTGTGAKKKSGRGKGASAPPADEANAGAGAQDLPEPDVPPLLEVKDREDFKRMRRDDANWQDGDLWLAVPMDTRVALLFPEWGPDEADTFKLAAGRHAHVIDSEPWFGHDAKARAVGLGGNIDGSQKPEDLDNLAELYSFERDGVIGSTINLHYAVKLSKYTSGRKKSRNIVCIGKNKEPLPMDQSFDATKLENRKAGAKFATSALSGVNDEALCGIAHKVIESRCKNDYDDMLVLGRALYGIDVMSDKYGIAEFGVVFAICIEALTAGWQGAAEALVDSMYDRSEEPPDLGEYTDEENEDHDDGGED